MDTAHRRAVERIGAVGVLVFVGMGCYEPTPRNERDLELVLERTIVIPDDLVLAGAKIREDNSILIWGSGPLSAYLLEDAGWRDVTDRTVFHRFGEIILAELRAAADRKSHDDAVVREHQLVECTPPEWTVVDAARLRTGRWAALVADSTAGVTLVLSSVSECAEWHAVAPADSGGGWISATDSGFFVAPRALNRLGQRYSLEGHVGVSLAGIGDSLTNGRVKIGATLQWVALRVISIDDESLQVVADERSPGRLLIRRDAKGIVVRTSAMEGSLSFVDSNSATRLALAVVDEGPKSVLLYRWRWHTREAVSQP